MSHDASNQQLLADWKKGDEDAATEIFRRYQTRLLALVRSRLAHRLARRIDPEDILLSAYRSFFVAVRTGRGEVAADDDLWPLLTTLTLRKLSRAARRHSADCRSVAREVADPSQWLDLAASQESAAEHAAILEDEVERLLRRLDATAREVLVRTLRGDDAGMIAQALAINERTVRRALERIRDELPSSGDAITSSVLMPVEANETVRESPWISLPAGTTTYDKYLLQQFLGSGAFSKVYRAVDRATGDVVAIKFLRKDCWNDNRAASALVQEFEILKRLSHSNILHIRDWGTTPRGALFLVTDYIPGRDLGRWASSNSASASRVADIVAQVARAVAVTHAHGILHCDLKPSNVLIRDDGLIVLCDFGFARYAVAPEDVPRGGTAGFLSPEQISDAFGPVTQRSDVYGLGALMYTLLTAKPPMSGRDLPETLTNVLSTAMPVAPSLIGADSTPELDAIVLRCLQKEPDRRFATADEVAAALSHLS